MLKPAEVGVRDCACRGGVALDSLGSVAPSVRSSTAIENASCAIAGAAQAKLQECPYSTVRHVICRCERGVVLLRGSVYSFYEKQLAQSIVSQVEGVQEVVNHIDVLSAEDDYIGFPTPHRP